MSPHTFIFIGPSGSGKGTQATLLQQYIKEHDTENRDVFYQQTGAHFREFWKTGSFGDVHAENSITHDLSRRIYDEGERQPDFLAVLMWGVALTQNFKGTEHLFFDGTPRSLNEAKMLETALHFYGRENVHVVYLKVSRKVSIDRLTKRAETRGRKDDQTREGIEKRLDWFEEDVWPAVEFYKSVPRYTLIELDGEDDIEEIQRKLVSYIS